MQDMDFGKQEARRKLGHGHSTFFGLMVVTSVKVGKCEEKRPIPPTPTPNPTHTLFVLLAP